MSTQLRRGSTEPPRMVIEILASEQGQHGHISCCRGVRHVVIRGSCAAMKPAVYNRERINPVRHISIVHRSAATSKTCDCFIKRVVFGT